MTSGIYRISNTVNSKIYIGSSVCIEQRWKAHRNEGKRYGEDRQMWTCSALYGAMSRLGVDKFSVECIEEIADEKAMREQEKIWIRKLDCLAPRGYNIASRALTDEQAAIIRFNALGFDKPRKEYAKLFSISDSLIGRIMGNHHVDDYAYLTRKHLPSDVDAYILQRR